MKEIILLYLVTLLGITNLKEDIRIFLNKSYKEYYKIEYKDDEIKKLKEELCIKECNYKIKDLEIRKETEMIVIHHCARREWSPNDINKFHKEKGWNGIGYNFYIRKDGSIYNGRGEEFLGAHMKGYNDVSIGICLEGNFEEEEVNEKQLEALNKLIFYCLSKYEVKKIVGHNDYGKTLCPGKNINIKFIKKTLIKNLKK